MRIYSRPSALRAPHIADAIAKEAGKWQSDLIVMGTHGRQGLQRLALGSDAGLVLRATRARVAGDESAYAQRLPSGRTRRQPE